MQTATATPKNQLIVAVKKIKGTSFVGVRNYKNLQNEESNQTFNVGIKYSNVLQYDLEALRKFDIFTLTDKFSIIDLTKAYSDLLLSLEKRTADEETKAKLLANNDKTMLQSKAQTDAYIHLSNGLKAKLEDDKFVLYVYGFMVRKTILKKGEYKEKNSRTLTIVKDAIKKAAGLKETKYKQFKLGNLEEIKISGLTLNIK